MLSGPNVLVVPTSAPFNTVEELVAYAKANPGKLNFASSGSGTSVHLSAELFMEMTGTQMVHVPYKGSGAVLPDLISGKVDLSFPNLPSALPLVKSGKLKALGVTTAQRSASAPQTPSIAEAGVPGYAMSTWYGLIGPAKMPAEVTNTLDKALQAVMHDPQVREALKAQGVDPVGSTAAQFTGFIGAETGRWAALLKKIGLEPR